MRFDLAKVLGSSLETLTLSLRFLLMSTTVAKHSSQLRGSDPERSIEQLDKVGNGIMEQLGSVTLDNDLKTYPVPSAEGTTMRCYSALSQSSRRYHEGELLLLGLCQASP